MSKAELNPASPPLVRILLVDDDEDMKVIIEHLLRRVPDRRFHIDCAGTFADGLTGIKKQAHDVYLVDYRLGERSGLDLIREATSQGIKVPIIVLTGAANPMIDLEATKIGAADFIVKDKMEATSLERSIRYAMQHFETLRQLQKSNERFRLLFERSLDAIFIADEEGRFVEVNAAACTLFGLSREQIARKHVKDLFPLDADKGGLPLPEQALGELSLVRGDQTPLSLEFSSCRFAPHLTLCILRDITDRRQLEKEIQEISEREQRRLGQDLHDGLGQMLTGINFMARALQQRLTGRHAAEAEDAAGIVSLINQALFQTRDLAKTLCPVELESNDIQAGLQQLVSNLELFFKVETQLSCDPDLKVANTTMAVHLYRIAQEAATNSVKHGEAKNIRISLDQEDAHLILRIEDDGKGFPQSGFTSKGMGLRVMQHRARMIGATLEIEGRKPRGISVTCRLESTPPPPEPPLKADAPKAEPAPKKTRSPAGKTKRA